jgi:hypothetical protein
MNNLMKRGFVLVVMLSIVTLVAGLGMVDQAKAVTPATIEDAVDIGVAALAEMQDDTNGNWGDFDWSASHPVASTCLALVKLQERAYDLNDPEIEDPFDPDYEYAANVVAGWEYVLGTTIVKTTPLTVQPAGDPDVNGNGYGLDFATGNGERYGYTNGIVLMALASTGTPDRENEGGLDFNGDGNTDTYLEIAQDVAEHLAYGQVDAPTPQRGGWHYTVGSGASQPPADNSVTGYSVLGLAYAEDFGVILPAFVKSEHDFWINYIQCGDGGSGYNAPNSSNLLRTGNLIFEMTFVDGGAASGTARFLNALSYIESMWQNPTRSPGWGYSLDPADYQAMYTLMKGLEYSSIDLIDTDGDTIRDDDWFNQEPSASPPQDFASVLLAQQNADGTWPGDCHQYGTPHLCQIWALLILEKISPPPPVNVAVDVEPNCICTPDDYDVKVTYTVERIPVDGEVNVYKDGVLKYTITLTNFSGTATEIYNIAGDSPGVKKWKAVMDVTPVGGGTPAHTEGEDTARVNGTPQVGDIPDQNAPFIPFDLDDYLTYFGPFPVSWSVSGVPMGWTVSIDADNVVTVMAPPGPPATLTFTASVNPPCGITCSDSDDAVFRPVIPVPLDIKPTSCPNPLNTNAKGVLPVAILGTEKFDVTRIDPATIRMHLPGMPLTFVELLRWDYEDVATPYVPFLDKQTCDQCITDGSDGYLDITLKFETQEVVDILGLSDYEDGSCVVIAVGGKLKPEFGGRIFLGLDVVKIINKAETPKPPKK